MERIVSKPSNEKYRKRYDKVFKKRKSKKKFNLIKGVGLADEVDITPEITGERSGGRRLATLLSDF